MKTVDLRNTYEVAEADELEQKDKVEITEFLCNLLMNKKKETNFDLKLEWNHLDIECILSFFKTKHDCLPTALDISTSNPESNMELFDEFSNLLINNKKLKYLKLYDVYINLQAFGRAAKINFSEKRGGPIMLIADLKNNLKFDKTLGAKLKSLDIVMISKKLQKNDKVQEFRLTDAMLGSEALETFT